MGRIDPCITVKTYKSNVYASHVDILDKDNNVVASVIYCPDDPLPCGAHVWITTDYKTRCIGKVSKPVCVFVCEEKVLDCGKEGC